MKKIILTVLCLCLLFSSGCNGDTTVDGFRYEGYKGPADAVMTVNGEAVSVDEFNYYLIEATHELKTENNIQDDKLDEFWSQKDISTGKTYEQIALENAVEKATEFHVYRTESNKRGIELSQEDKDSIYQQANSMRETYGDEMNRLQLKAGGLTQEVYSDLCEMGFYRNKLFSNYVGTYPEVSDDELNKFYNDNFIRAKHILAMTIDDETQEPLSEEEQAAAYAKISEAYGKVADGGDFDAVMAEYSEDPGLQQYPHGYTFTMDDGFSEGFKQVSLILKEGEISEIIQTESGYHIIKREPLLAYEDATNDEVVLDKLMRADFENELDKLNSEAEVIVNKSVFEKVSPGDVLSDYLISYDETLELIKQEYIKFDEAAAE